MKDDYCYRHYVVMNNYFISDLFIPVSWVREMNLGFCQDSVKSFLRGSNVGKR